MQVGDLWVKLTLSDKDFKKGISSTKKSVSSFGDTVVRTGATIGAVLGTIASATVTRFAINFNASMEQARMGFTTMLGSAKKADAFLRELATFAANTPFDFPGLRNTAQTMMALGFEAEEIIPTLTAIGDAMAAMGKDQTAIDRIIAQMGQIKTTGRATWEDIKVMSENGVKALDYLAEGLGITVAEVRDKMKDGAIDADTAIKIITEGMEKDFGGMMKNMETTWTGMVSNIKDGAGFLIGTAFQPIFEYARDNVLPVIKDIIAKLQENIDTGGGLSGALKVLIPEGLKDEIKLVSDFIGGLKEKIESQDWEGVGVSIGTALGTVIKNITGIGQQLASKFIDEVKAVDWSTVGRNSVEVAIGFIAGFVAGILDPVTWLEIVKKYWKPLLEAVIGIILLPESWIAKIVVGLRKIPFAGKILAWLVESISKIGKKALDPVITFFKDMGSSFMSSFLKALGLDGVKILPLLRGLIDDAIKGIKSFGEDLYLRGLYFMERLGAGIANLGPKQVIQGFKNILAGADEVLSGFTKTAFNIGADIIKGLRNGISSLGGWIKTKIKEFVGGIGSTIKDFFGISSPSKLMAEFGRYIAEGLAMGIAENNGKVKDMAALMAQSITSALDTVTGSLNLTAQIAQAKFDLMVAKMGENMTQSELLRAEMALMQEQLQLQADKVSILKDAYDRMVEVKGAAAEESKELQLELIREMTAYEQLAAKIREANKEQTDLWANLARAKGDKKKTHYAAMLIGVQEAYNRTGDVSFVNGVPQLAEGGIVTRPTLAMIGEAGPEAVVPLEKMSSQTKNNNTFIFNIKPEDLEGLQTVLDFFRRWPQIARAMGIVTG